MTLIPPEEMKLDKYFEQVNWLHRNNDTCTECGVWTCFCVCFMDEKEN